MQTLKPYFDHLIAKHFKAIKARVVLWHKEITLGEFITEDNDAMDWADYLSRRESRKWMGRAWRHRLQTPPRISDELANGVEYWETGWRDHHKQYLNKDGIRFILDQYREEKAARRDVIIKWATLIFAAMAAIGVISKL